MLKINFCEPLGQALIIDDVPCCDHCDEDKIELYEPVYRSRIHVSGTLSRFGSRNQIQGFKN
jgi:hypothetical protein